MIGQALAAKPRQPHGVHTEFAAGLSGAKAKTIGYTVFFAEPQVDAGLVYIKKLSGAFAASSLNIPQDPDSEKFDALLKEAVSALDSDRKLASSFKAAGNVLLPWILNGFPVEPQGKRRASAPEAARIHSAPVGRRPPA